MPLPGVPLPGVRSPGRGFWLLWGGFCSLMLLVALQEVLFDGGTHWPWRLFDEIVALAVATGVAAWRWRSTARDDALLTTPGRWYLRVLRPMPWLALAFVGAMYGLRHAARATLGLSYEHAPWPVVLGYECVKFSIFYLLLSGVQFGHRSHLALAAERLRTAQLEQLSAQARLQQLTQQMQPHFLFNALNTIAGLLHEDAAAADAALVRLAALLRAATDATAQTQHTWAQELALGRSYAELMAQRFGSRVRLHWCDDPSAADCRVPALSLQPLLENCFVHGVERERGVVNITVSVHRHGGQLNISVSNDAAGGVASVGVGARFAWAEGVGLGNLRQRLAALHGQQAALTLAAAPPPQRGVVVRLVLPA